MQNILSVGFKKFSRLSIVSIATLSIFLPSQVLASPDDIVGEWYNDTKESKIQVYKSGNKYFGKISWLKVPNKNGKPKTDENNPDPTKKNKPTLGLVILKDLKNVSDMKWEDGKIYDPKNGKEYRCEIKMKDNKTLDLRGYIGISLFGRTSVWTRA